MDHRSEEDFKEDVSQFTEKEFYWGMSLRIHLIENGLDCRIEEHGVDNTGKLIRGRLPNANADKMFHFTSGKPPVKVEVKTIPEWCTQCFTFKTCALKGCYAQRAYILVPRSGVHYILGRTAFRHLIENLPVRTDIKTFGYKPCVRASSEMIEEMVGEGMIKKQRWSPAASKYIKKMGEILFAERKTGQKTRA